MTPEHKGVLHLLAHHLKWRYIPIRPLRACQVGGDTRGQAAARCPDYPVKFALSL